MKPAFRSIRYAAATALAAFALSSCSLLGGGAVSQEDLEKGVAAELNDQTGQDNPATCEGDLEAEEDATQQCTWENDSGQKVPVEVTATKVDGDQVEYSIDPQPPESGDSEGSGDGDSGTPVPQSALEKEVRQQMDKQTGKSFPVTCKGDLEGKVGATQRCVWHADDGSTLGIDVSVTEIEDGQARFHIQADQKATPAPKKS